jgi:hypothetical protein
MYREAEVVVSVKESGLLKGEVKSYDNFSSFTLLLFCLIIRITEDGSPYPLYPLPLGWEGEEIIKKGAKPPSFRTSSPSPCGRGGLRG